MRPTSSAVETDMPEDFPYGWRYVTLPGRDEPEQVPLTLEDVLHPLEGDVIAERIYHNEDREYLRRAFGSRPVGPPHVHVASDLLTDFGVAGVRNMSPDTAIFVGMREAPDRLTGLLELGSTGGRCLLVAEIVSPDTRVNDVVHKVDLYHRVKVENYVIIDRRRLHLPRFLVGYRWAPDGYEPLPLDDEGRLLVPVVGLRLRVDAEDNLICEDPVTGHAVPRYAQLSQALEDLQHRDVEREREMEDVIERSRREARARLEAETRASQAESREALHLAEMAILREALARLQGTPPP